MARLSRRSFVVGSSVALATPRALLAASQCAADPMSAAVAATDADPYKFSLVRAADSPIPGGMVHRANKAAFPILVGVASFSLQLDPGAIRQPHLYTNANEISYIAIGRARVGLIGPGARRTGSRWGRGDGLSTDGMAALAGEYRGRAALRALHVLA